MERIVNQSRSKSHFGMDIHWHVRLNGPEFANPEGVARRAKARMRRQRKLVVIRREFLISLQLERYYSHSNNTGFSSGRIHCRFTRGRGPRSHPRSASEKPPACLLQPMLASPNLVPAHEATKCPHSLIKNWILGPAVLGVSQVYDHGRSIVTPRTADKLSCLTGNRTIEHLLLGDLEANLRVRQAVVKDGTIESRHGRANHDCALKGLQADRETFTGASRPRDVLEGPRERRSSTFPMGRPNLRSHLAIRRPDEPGASRHVDRPC